MHLTELHAVLQGLPSVWLGYALIIVIFLLLFSLWGIWRLAQRNEQTQKKNQHFLQRALQDVVSELERNQQETVQRNLQALQMVLSDKLSRLERQLLEDASNLKITLEKNQYRALKSQQETLATTLGAMGQQIQQSLRFSSDELGERVIALTQTTDQRLQEINQQVEQRLQEGFENTTRTFTQVLEHLSRIDEAQKRIAELSSNVVSLQEILTDKRSRGAFGEVQLLGLIRNMMPENSFEEQAVLSNGKRVDCLLHLPDPTGSVPIDAKFPLESYQRMQNMETSATERAQAVNQFRRDIRKHIHDIASKYLLPGETADGAVMFIPAEAVFAEIYARHPELVKDAQRARVWMVSPTTLMAVLTTARAVLKDDATRRQIHIIQDHLRKLADDFTRFQQRMDKLASHIRQANEDVDHIHTSAKKISQRFTRIEAAELDQTMDGQRKKSIDQ